MDEVIHIIDEDGELTLFFTSYNGDRPYIWSFESEESTILRNWLEENSTTL